MGDCKLLPMNSRGVLAVASFLLVLACSGCNGEARKPRVDSTSTTDPQSAAPPPVPSTGWDEAAGRALFLSMTADPGSVAVVLPNLTDSTLVNAREFDSTGVANSRIELFGPHGLAGEVALKTVSPPAAVAGCQSWPHTRISDLPRKPWRIGFFKGRVTGVPLDSIEGMSAADSAAFTGEITRMVAASPQAGDSAFQGLPFAVRKAYRFSTGSTTGFIATVVRKINEEANPRQEHSLLIGERSASTLREVFRTRAAGSEESVQTNEILAFVNIAETGQPAIVVTFEHEEGGRVGLLERASDGRWRSVWKSAYTGC